MTITSPHNEKLKEIRKLARARTRATSGRFVAEGEDLLAAADAAGWPAIERFCAAGSSLDGVEVEQAILASVSSLGSGTRALAVYDERWAAQPVGPLCVYLHGVADPGNVGTVLRSAAAFGASSVAIGPGTADPYGPKAVRASMGAVFGVPLARADPLAHSGDRDALPGDTIALVSGGGRELVRFGSEGWNQIASVRQPLTIMVGSERDGLPEALTARADHRAHIPIRTHSLNAAIAASIALYELARRMPPG